MDREAARLCALYATSAPGIQMGGGTTQSTGKKAGMSMSTKIGTKTKRAKLPARKPQGAGRARTRVRTH
jgi:hypothetical protein